MQLTTLLVNRVMLLASGAAALAAALAASRSLELTTSAGDREAERELASARRRASTAGLVTILTAAMSSRTDLTSEELTAIASASMNTWRPVLGGSLSIRSQAMDVVISFSLCCSHSDRGCATSTERCSQTPKQHPGLHIMRSQTFTRSLRLQGLHSRSHAQAHTHIHTYT